MEWEPTRRQKQYPFYVQSRRFLFAQMVLGVGATLGGMGSIGAHLSDFIYERAVIAIGKILRVASSTDQAPVPIFFLPLRRGWRGWRYQRAMFTLLNDAAKFALWANAGEIMPDSDAQGSSHRRGARV